MNKENRNCSEQQWNLDTVPDANIWTRRKTTERDTATRFISPYLPKAATPRIVYNNKMRNRTVFLLCAGSKWAKCDGQNKKNVHSWNGGDIFIRKTKNGRRARRQMTSVFEKVPVLEIGKQARQI